MKMSLMMLKNIGSYHTLLVKNNRNPDLDRTTSAGV